MQLVASIYCEGILILFSINIANKYLVPQETKDGGVIWQQEGGRKKGMEGKENYKI